MHSPRIYSSVHKGSRPCLTTRVMFSTAAPAEPMHTRSLSLPPSDFIPGLNNRQAQEWCVAPPATLIHFIPLTMEEKWVTFTWALQEDH
mmetsp:Transcript_121840/g.211547  ORF Transcript_121840/g.211547 Transcript_121840/m.211547 type:complete len:89 (+) Transcript_121840:1497-1763(+)